MLAAVAVLSLRSLRRRKPDAAAAEVPPATHLYGRFLALTAINPTTVVYFVALIAGLPAIASASAPAKLIFVLAVGRRQPQLAAGRSPVPAPRCTIVCRRAHGYGPRWPSTRSSSDSRGERRSAPSSPA